MSTSRNAQLGLPEIIGAAWNAIAEEMGRALVRTAISPNIKERRDCSAAIFAPDGQLLAQAAHIPIHISALFEFPKFVCAQDNLRPGDMFVSNDPYSGIGSHLNDIAVAAPVFADGELVAVVATIAHHLDVGGAVPGSESPASTEIFQEGLRIPPIRLVCGGLEVSDVWKVITYNSRLPDFVDSDLRAQMAAVETGVGRVQELAGHYGLDALAEASNTWLDYAERRFRTRCAQIGDLNFTIDGELDDDGLGGPGVTVRGTGSITDQGVVIDLTDSDPVAAGGINSPLSATQASIYYALRSVIDPGCPSNQGSLRAIQVKTKPGTVVDPRPPSAIGHRIAPCQKLASAIIRGIAETTANYGAAESHGLSLVIFSGTGPQGRFVNYEALAGGHGAGPNGPGLTGTQAHTTNSSNLPIEVMEHEYPLRVLRYQIRRGSGGAGGSAGGDGIERAYEVLAEDVQVTLALMDARVPPAGARGGRDGAPAAATLMTRQAAEKLPPHKSGIRISPGSQLVIETGGGGGWGSP